MYRKREINEETIRLINQGDARAFEDLYAAYYVFLGSVATKYVYQVEIAREIINDVFLNLWHNRSTLAFPVHPYLVCAVRNRCLNYLQRRRMSEFSLTEAQEQLFAFQEAQISQDEQPLAQLENKEIQDEVRRAVYALPEKCRNIFIQYLYYNKSYEEIAGLYAISTITVRRQVGIAMEKLRKSLAKLNAPLYLLLLFFPK